MKKKKMLFIIIPILLVLLIGVGLALLYFTTDMFKTNDVLFAKYFMQSGEIFNIAQNENLNNQTDLRKTNTYKSAGDLTVSIDDGINIQEIKATTATRYDGNTQRLYSEMNLKKGEEDLLKLSFINSDDIYAIKCDDILGNYIGVRNSNLKTFAKNMGMSDEEIEFIPDSIELDALNEFLEITEEQKQHIIDNYSNIIIDNISKDKFTKVQEVNVAANNMNYKATGYILSIDIETIKNITIGFLNKLKEDNITLALLSDKLSMFGIDDEILDITNLSKTLNETVTEMQKELTNNEEIMKITLYSYKGSLIKTEIQLLEKGNVIGKITIDISDTNNTKKANIVVKSESTVTSLGSSTHETIDKTNMQITLEKTITDTNIINKIKVVPDMTNMSQYTLTETNIGKVQNNIVSNISNVTISNSTDNTNIETISASYVQNIEFTSQIEEIMELKNSNTVIINNYSLEQLTPFLTNLGNKIEIVIPNKIGQLEIGMGENISNGEISSSNIENMSSSIIQIGQAIGAAGSCIMNVNGNLNELGANIGFTAVTYTVKIAMMIIEQNVYNNM